MEWRNGSCAKRVVMYYLTTCAADEKFAPRTAQDFSTVSRNTWKVCHRASSLKSSRRSMLRDRIQPIFWQSISILDTPYRKNDIKKLVSIFIKMASLFLKIKARVIRRSCNPYFRYFFFLSLSGRYDPLSYIL